MSDENWCDFNDMPKNGCAHCQESPELDGKAKPLLGTIVVAKHRGRCVACNGDIEPGDHIGPVDGEGWAHYGCGQ